ncbi:unnamed protein product [Urochloa humidicola]
MAQLEQAVFKQTAPAICNGLFTECGRACNAGHIVDDVVEALSHLTALKSDLQIALERSPHQMQPQHVESWLKRVEKVTVDVNKINQDYSKRCLCLGCSLNIISSYTVSRRAAQQHQRVNDLLNEYDEKLKNILGRGGPASCIRKPLPNVVVGKSSHLTRVLALLADDSTTGIIGISGMPGVGKSELMRCINNEFLPDTDRGETDFKFVVWVDNAGSGVKAVQDKIAQRLELGDLGPLAEDKEGDAERRASPIFSTLSNTSFLVLLDNLTSPVPLASIGVPNPIHRRSDHKQKVVLTTPFKDVSGKMSCNYNIHLQCLDADDSRGLFASFINQGQMEKNKVIAKQVIEECGGLPIALTMIGGAMATKRDPEDWRRMLQLLKSSRLYLIPGMEAQSTAVLQGLEKCYHRLSDSYKQSFLCCCLWPRGCSIDKKDLIDCWVGLGLITDPSPEAAALDGFSIISHLQEAYLLLPGDNADEQVKLQPIVRDMALWIACDCGKNNKWMVHDGVNLNAQDRAIELCTSAAGAERVSLMHSHIQEVRQSVRSSSNCPSLAVLMLQHSTRLTTISGSFLGSAPALKYLDLSHTGIEQLPEELGTLLIMLQFLNLSFTKVKALPAGLGNHNQIKHLLLKHTSHLSFIPPGFFRSLPNLQVIDMYPSQYMDWDREENKDDITRVDDGSSKEEEISILEQLSRSAAFIRSLGITINTFSMVRMLGRLVNVCTTRLLMTNLRSTAAVTLCPSGFKLLMGSFSLLETLQEVSIDECHTLEQLVLDGEEDQGEHNDKWCLRKLKSLKLHGLSKLEDVVIRRMSTTFFLQALECVRIQGCDRIKDVSWAVRLNCLKHLELRNCAALCTVIRDDGPQDANELPPTFNKLITLLLEDMQKLTSICSPQVGFPCVKLVQVVGCDNLVTMPKSLKPESEAKVPEIRGSPDWKAHLKWE